MIWLTCLACFAFGWAWANVVRILIARHREARRDLANARRTRRRIAADLYYADFLFRRALGLPFPGDRG
ncbi:hypothetical protein OG530_19155 [Streptomyces decoyicus]|uniref:hypothetical protein n=1 Tax=Streptomyces decoyicus TaxID=249567 RepID=UPI002E1889B2